MRYLFFAVALAALVIGGWNTAELMKRQRAEQQSPGTLQTGNSPSPAINSRLAEIENSILELAANSANQTNPTLPTEMERRIAQLEENASNTPTGFDASQLFEGMAELAAKIQTLENSPSAAPTANSAQPFDPSDLFAGLAEINDRIGKLEQNSSTSDQGTSQKAVEALQNRLALLEDRNQTTPTPIDADALFEGVAELASRIDTLEKQIAVVPQNSGEPALKQPDIGSIRETIEQFESLNERVASLEKQPALQKAGHSDELLAGILEINQRLEILEKRQSNDVRQQALLEIGETLELQAKEITELKADQRKIAEHGTENNLNEALIALTQRLALLEKRSTEDEQSAGQNELLTGMIELSKKVSKLEEFPQDSELKGALALTNQQIQEQASAIALLQEKSQNAEDSGQISEIIQGIDAIETRIANLENRDTSNHTTIPSDLFDNLQSMSKRLDEIEVQANSATTNQSKTNGIEQLATRVSALEVKQIGTGQTGSPPSPKLFENLQELSNRLDSLEEDQSSSKLTKEISLGIEQLAVRVQALETQPNPEANSEQLKILDSVSILSDRLVTLEETSKKPIKVPQELLEGISSVSERIDSLERTSNANTVKLETFTELTSQIDSLGSQINSLTARLKDAQDGSPNEEILTGLAELSDRINTLEKTAGNTKAEQIDGDALFEGMATLAHRIGQLEDKLK